MNKNILILIISLFSFMIYAEEFELRSESAYKIEHNNRYTGIFGLNPSMTKSNQIMNAHFAYAKNTEENRWWELNFTYTQAYANKITTNNSAATGMNSQTFGGTDYSNQLAFGAGISYESKYFQNLLPIDDIYEISSASGTLDIFKNTSAGKSFIGPGMLARFSILKRFNNYIAFGTNFVYNLAVVKRSQDANENSSSRSLTLSHLTLGLDFTFYL